MTDYHNLPQAVGSIEPFCDETVVYMEELKPVGVPLTYKVFDGCFHFAVHKFVNTEVKPTEFPDEPNDFDSWTAPEGYINEEIELSLSSGYLLKDEDENHGKVVYQIHGRADVSVFTSSYNTNAIMLSEASGDWDVFSIDYRTGAQSPDRAALDDAVEGYEWLLNQGYKAENIVVARPSRWWTFFSNDIKVE